MLFGGPNRIWVRCSSRFAVSSARSLVDSLFATPNLSVTELMRTASEDEALSAAAKLSIPTTKDVQNANHAMLHFMKILTKHGKQHDLVLARVNAVLRHRYQNDHPIAMAIDAIKPCLRYQRLKATKGYKALPLAPKAAYGIAIRWVIQAANARTYLFGNVLRPDLERGLVDELDTIIQGTSALYTKRFHFHRNPN